MTVNLLYQINSIQPGGICANIQVMWTVPHVSKHSDFIQVKLYIFLKVTNHGVQKALQKGNGVSGPCNNWELPPEGVV